jgi:hypothetical protein
MYSDHNVINALLDINASSVQKLTPILCQEAGCFSACAVHSFASIFCSYASTMTCAFLELMLWMNCLPLLVRPVDAQAVYAIPRPVLGPGGQTCEQFLKALRLASEVTEVSM